MKVNTEYSFTLITVSAKIRTLYFLFSSVFDVSLEVNDVYTVVYDCRSHKISYNLYFVLIKNIYGIQHNSGKPQVILRNINSTTVAQTTNCLDNLNLFLMHALMM